jgi:hypothetical protein
MKMYRMRIIFILIGILFISSPAYAKTEENLITHKSVISSEKSAEYQILYNLKKENYTDNRKIQLARVLSRYNSPLIGYVDEIVSSSDLYGIDWKLVPAIAGVESGFCRKIPYNSFNCWGFDNGSHTFSDYKSAVYEVARVLRLHYIDKGLTSPERMSSVYAPPSSTWASKVRYFMSILDTNLTENLSLQINI